MSRWTETSTLEILCGMNLLGGGIYALSAQTSALPAADYASMISWLSPTQWGFFLIFTGLVQMVATMVNGYGIRWTPVTRWLSCSASFVVMSLLTYGNIASQGDPTISITISAAMAIASAWCALIRANIILERFFANGEAS